MPNRLRLVFRPDLPCSHRARTGLHVSKRRSPDGARRRGQTIGLVEIAGPDAGHQAIWAGVGELPRLLGVIAHELGDAVQHLCPFPRVVYGLPRLLKCVLGGLDRLMNVLRIAAGDFG
jgi:hypothetical protein